MGTYWLACSKNEGHSSYEELKKRQVLAQGWPEIGDLSTFNKKREDPDEPSATEEAFKQLINALVIFAYGEECYGDDPGRILLTLLNLKEGDLVVCTEGTKVCGIARVERDSEYQFHNNKAPGNEYYEYAHTINNIKEWHDWDGLDAGPAPKTSGQGPNGVERLVNDSGLVVEVWERPRASPN